MVFPGHFSTGCLRCRQRKVKCDETKPSCRRCYMYGKPCLGYTDQFHFRHSLTQSNFGKAPAPSSASTSSASTSILTTVSRPARKQTSRPPPGQQTKQKSPPADDHNHGNNDNGDDHKTRRNQNRENQNRALHRVITRPPSLSYDHVSLCYFVHRFITPNGTDGFPGHLSCLPALYDDHNQGLLETATMSVAQMAAYNRYGTNNFRLQSYRNYGRAIRMMRAAIQSEEFLTDDRLVTTILLFCALKDISGDGPGDPNEHASGLFYLLEKRGLGQLATTMGSELFFISLLRLQVHSFYHNNATYSDPGAIATVMGLFNPLLRAMSLMSKTLSLRHSLSRHCMSFEARARARAQARARNKRSGDAAQTASSSSPPPPQEDIEDALPSVIVQQCFETLDDFYNWDAEAASYWQSAFEDRTTPVGLGEVAWGTTFYDPETACTIILIRSARLILLLSLLLYRGKMRQQEQQQRRRNQNRQHDDGDQGSGPALVGDAALWEQVVPALEQDVTKAVDDILSSVPYSLGDVDTSGLPSTMAHDGAGAMIIVHSIRLVANSAYTTPEQMQKAKNILTRINAIIGIRSATELVDGEVNTWLEDQSFLRSMAAAGGVGSSPEERAGGPV